MTGMPRPSGFCLAQRCSSSHHATLVPEVLQIRADQALERLEKNSREAKMACRLIWRTTARALMTRWVGALAAGFCVRFALGFVMPRACLFLMVLFLSNVTGLRLCIF